MNKEVSPFIPLCVPQIGTNEWKYVKECLDTHWVSYVGSYVNRFEELLADVTGAQFCVATNSGTAALHLGLLLSGADTDTEVIMPAISFVSPANAVRYCGAWPTFIDIDPRTWQIDLGKLSDFLDRQCKRDAQGRLINQGTGRQVTTLMPVHLLGELADVDELAVLAAKYDLPLLEDGAECLGATYQGRGIAAPTPAIDPEQRIVITSFNGNKIVTTGGGGALMTNSPSLAERAKHLSTTAKTDPIEFHHDEVGYNYRLSNVSAAIGVGQLELLPQYVDAKRAIADRYDTAFSDWERIETSPQLSYCNGIRWMYSIRLDVPSQPLVAALNEHQIQSRPLWVPLHQLPAFREESYQYHVEFAQQFYETALSLPCSVSLTEEQQTRVIEFIGDWL